MEPLTLETITADALFWPILGLVAWTILWKGWALWLAARRGEKVWFVALLLLNTLGILEIAYIVFVARNRSRKEGAAL